MGTPPTSQDTLFSLGRAPGEGAGERAEEVAANFPLGCCLHPGDELAVGFTVCSPAGMPGEAGWLLPSFNALALLDLGTRMHSRRKMTPDSCLQLDV